jgi:hypothetical protein
MGHAPQTLVFDRVVIADNGRSSTLTAEAFIALPLPERIRHILGRSAQFFNGAVLVERHHALRSLQQLLGAAAARPSR